MRFRSLLAGLAPAVIVLFCTLPTRAATEEQIETIFAKTVALMEDEANLVDKDKDDCAKMALDLEHLADANRAFLAEAATFRRSLSDEERKKYSKAFTEKYKARIIASTKKLMGGMTKCGGDRSVMTALKRLTVD